jgi:hypothetical protein
MPITDPDPHKILAGLRANEAQLRALVAAQPENALAKAALGSVEVAIGALTASLASSTPPA